MGYADRSIGLARYLRIFRSIIRKGGKREEGKEEEGGERNQTELGDKDAGPAYIYISGILPPYNTHTEPDDSADGLTFIDGWMDGWMDGWSGTVRRDAMFLTMNYDYDTNLRCCTSHYCRALPFRISAIGHPLSFRVTPPLTLLHP